MTLLAAVSSADMAGEFEKALPTPALDALWSSFLLFLPRVAVALAILLVFWLLARGLRRLLRRLGEHRKIDASITSLVAGSLQVTVLLIGLLCGLGTAGIDITALVAGLGLTGLAISLALKEVFSNVLSGILVVAYKPFREGDVITVATATPTVLEGTVREINLRFTRLEAEEKKIYVPNSLILSNAVVVRQQGAAGAPQTPTG
ncbi:MAG: mechanosensitive ion channel domain-containing protein [Thermoguttaceae bacterium]|jgi:small-conductance mechanosensitive channel